MSGPTAVGQPQSSYGTTRQKIALVIFTLTSPVLAFDYWSNGGRLTFFGDVPLLLLFAIACIGGAVSFPLFTERRGCWLAIFPGALCGFGAFGLHFLYTTWMEKESLTDSESMSLALVGAAPGLLMYWALMKILKPEEDRAR